MIGIDFDNTIVRYDALFHRLAAQRGWLTHDVTVTKAAVRDHLRAAGREDHWTRLQGLVYGPRINDAALFPGVLDFFTAARRAEVSLHIVSHKTAVPYRGEPYDLHAAARGFLESHGIVAPAHFELTRQAKLERIAALGCAAFIDDLPEFLAEPGFPQATRRVLFDPADAHVAAPDIERARSWAELAQRLLPGGRPA